MLNCPTVILVVFNKVVGSGSPPHLLKDNMRCIWDQFPPTDPTHARLELWRIPHSGIV